MRSALAFSGGRDSLAMLLRLQALWHVLDVVFVDAGDAFPQTSALMERMSAVLPHFTRVRTDARAWRVEHGDPTDANWSRCCSANFWVPLHKHLKAGGYRQVLRGDRADEGHVQLVMPGDVIDGILFTFPMWTWSEAQVMEYLSKRGALARPYAAGAEGLPDCRTCTAEAACGNRTKHLWEHA